MAKTEKQETKSASKKTKTTTALAGKEEEVILPSMKFSIEKWNGELQELNGMAVNLVIASAEQEAAAIDIGTKAKRIKDEAEQVRTNTVKPVNDAVKQVNAKFGFTTDQADTIIKTVKEKILNFRAAENIKRLEAETKAAKAKFKGGKAAANAPAPPPAPSTKIVGKEGIGKTKQNWKFEILDKTKIPMDYMIADEKSIGVAVRSGVRSIPGVKIYPEDNISLG
jgi:hypothetical protein